MILEPGTQVVIGERFGRQYHYGSVIGKTGKVIGYNPRAQRYTVRVPSLAFPDRFNHWHIHPDDTIAFSNNEQAVKILHNKPLGGN